MNLKCYNNIYYMDLDHLENLINKITLRPENINSIA